MLTFRPSNTDKKSANKEENRKGTRNELISLRCHQEGHRFQVPPLLQAFPAQTKTEQGLVKLCVEDK